MKTLALTVLTALMCVGCTTYPQNYTYSPTVTVAGGGGNTPINLPNPFAKTPHKRTEFIHTYTNSQPQTQYIPCYSNVVVPEYSPPTHVQTDSRYYYEADPDSRSNRQCQTSGRDIITELETFVIP